MLLGDGVWGDYNQEFRMIARDNQVKFLALLHPPAGQLSFPPVSEIPRFILLKLQRACLLL